MSGGIAQLVAQGAQDVHLVGNPQVSFFRSTYKRHTNFSQVRQRQTIQGNPAANGMSSVRFERKGDLLSYTYLTGKLISSGEAEPNPGEFIDKVELYIGGQLINTQDNDFSTGVWPQVQASTVNKVNVGSSVARQMYPLHFFFCENWASSLPLVALQYHDVTMRIYWNANFGGAKTYELWSNFIYLDTDEREMFAQKPQDMLITQVQKNNGSGNSMQDFSFNHPVSYIACGANKNDGTAGRSDSCSSTTGISTQLTLSINGTTVGDPSLITPHYNNVPINYNMFYSPLPRFCIPFGLDLYRSQPSGSLNFSRLDSARINLDGSSICEKPFYAVNYNVLHIEKGMGGLLYSN